jgi:hypothetical protein
MVSALKKLVRPIAFCNAKYSSVSALIQALGGRVSIPKATLRFRLRRGFEVHGKYEDLWMSDALFLPISEYRRKHATRRSKVCIDGKLMDLAQVYAQLPGQKIAWENFHKRMRRFKNVSTELIHDAANMNRANWITFYGGGRRKSFRYEGALYADEKGEFPSVTAFLKAIGRYEDRNLIHDRLKAGWDVDDALCRPTTSSCHARCTIYAVRQVSTGRIYIGSTIRGIRTRWKEHVSIALSGESNAPLHRALRQFGVGDFQIRALEEGFMSAEKQATRECAWIGFLQAALPRGFNAATGGALGNRGGTMVMVDDEPYWSYAEASRCLSERTGLPDYVIQARLRANLPLPCAVRKRSKHPAAGSRLYRKWSAMLRGNRDQNVGVCRAWHDFDIWKEQTMADENESFHLIRPDRKQPWGPENFLWGTARHKVQSSHGKAVTVFGSLYKSQEEVCMAFGVKPSTFRQRIARGMALEDALTRPIGGHPTLSDSSVDTAPDPSG